MVISYKKKINKKLIIFGVGGHCKVVIDAAKLNGIQIKGIITDLFKSKKNDTYFKAPILGNIDFIKKIDLRKYFFIVAIGDNSHRAKIYNFLKKRSAKFISVIHPTATVSESAYIKPGCFINAKAIINANSKISENTIINTDVLIEHDVNIGKNCHIAPSAKIGGGASIMDNSFIGMGSILINKIKVGKKVIVGAGSIIFRNLKSNKKFVGYTKEIK